VTAIVVFRGLIGFPSEGDGGGVVVVWGSSQQNEAEEQQLEVAKSGHVQ